MAKNKSTVYLGYEDEEINDKHASLLNSTVNKVGGTPDWPNGEIKIPSCPLCGTARPLVVQLYAPLDMSQFHRSLFIFACLNPICSQNSKSWLCVRTQHLETPDHSEIIKVVASPKNGKQKKKKDPKQATSAKLSWCSGADDWGIVVDEVAVKEAIEQMDTGADDCNEPNEENGNVINPKNVNLPVSGNHLETNDEDEDDDRPLSNEDDEEDESNSMDNDLILSFNQMDVRAPQNIAEDPNANCAGAAAGGGVGGIAAACAENEGNYACSGASAVICAEIEGPETDVVLVESPQKPERDLIALMKHTPTPAALGPLAKLSDLSIKSFFIAVDLECKDSNKEYDSYSDSLSSEHIRDLYQEYKKQDETALSPGSAAVSGNSASGSGGNAVAGAGTPEDQEGYEKAIPAHGDLMFHYFLGTIQQNPGQILRYSRDTLPLLIAPLQEPTPKCPNCNGDTICEVQILSTLIPKLKMQQSNESAPLEFGNVLIFTCLKSCWDTPDKMRYEKVIVQAEK
ncbi:programmed cell death protein 2-like [Stomoxys calcitrans]|uniref:programmed cell death protein 2-like n=1 Tax=Stomoxys calcitrans TaxID=35570 RepID=UPI0027E25F48|nr:programmed cell death protein 2-like [Stomoxys calcitrans]